MDADDVNRAVGSKRDSGAADWASGRSNAVEFFALTRRERLGRRSVRIDAPRRKQIGTDLAQCRRLRRAGVL
jgi:hypothetical protein